jgi:hypothetical protein
MNTSTDVDVNVDVDMDMVMVTVTDMVQVMDIFERKLLISDHSVIRLDRHQNRLGRST